MTPDFQPTFKALIIKVFNANFELGRTRYRSSVSDPIDKYLIPTKRYKPSKYSCSKGCNLEQCTAAKSLQSCPTLCDPTDGSPPGSPISGILQARTLEWVAISFSNAWKWKVKVKLLSRVQLSVTPWTAAYQASPMGFSRQKYWSGLPLPSPRTEYNQPMFIN